MVKVVVYQIEELSSQRHFRLSQKWADQPSIFCDLFQKWDAVVFISRMCM